MESLSWDVSSEPADADLQVVDASLTAYNLQAGNIGQVRALTVVVKDGAEVVAGLIARTWGECCEIQVLWVRQDLRNKGIGRELMIRAEAEAAARDCRLIYLDTFSFQAPAFYQSLGYEPFQIIDGFPDGVRKYYLKKTLPR